MLVWPKLLYQMPWNYLIFLKDAFKDLKTFKYLFLFQWLNSRWGGRFKWKLNRWIFLSDSFCICNFFLFNIYIFICLTTTLNSSISILTLVSAIIFDSFGLVSLYLLVDSDRWQKNPQICSVSDFSETTTLECHILIFHINIFQENSVLLVFNLLWQKEVTFH